MQMGIFSIERDADMCTVFEGTRAQGRAKELIIMECEFGFSENDILQRLSRKLDVNGLYSKRSKYGKHKI